MNRRLGVTNPIQHHPQINGQFESGIQHHRLINGQFEYGFQYRHPITDLFEVDNMNKFGLNNHFLLTSQLFI